MLNFINRLLYEKSYDHFNYGTILGFMWFVAYVECMGLVEGNYTLNKYGYCICQ